MPARYDDLSGNSPFRGITVGDGATDKNRPTYLLANGVTVAGNARTAPVYGVRRADYLFFASFGGTSPSLKLQYLGEDNTWYDVTTAITTTGTFGSKVSIGNASTVSILNTTANAITNLIAKLS